MVKCFPIAIVNLELSPIGRDARCESQFVLFDLQTEGINEEDAPGGLVRLKAFFTAPFDAHLFDEYGPTWEEEPERDWRKEMEGYWPSIEVGRFFIVAPWSTDETPDGLLRLCVHPGLAFGTGRDTTTQLCLEALEQMIQPGMAVLDVGTGSGILAEAAFLLGATKVEACDIDPVAAQAAREQLPAQIGIFVGSARSVSSGWADLIIANINAETITNLAPEFKRILKPEGKVVLCGVPIRHADRVTACMETYELPVTHREERDIWVRLIC